LPSLRLSDSVRPGNFSGDQMNQPQIIINGVELNSAQVTTPNTNNFNKITNNTNTNNLT
jgi:hypothetical protein